MEYTIAVIKKIIFFNLLLLSFNGFSQNKTYTTNSILGDWKCVKKDYRGYQNYSFEQAEAIKKSILHIEKTTFYFKNISFIERCSFYGWQIKPYDMNLPIESIKTIYSEEELKRMFLLEPVDQGGNLACYNNCITILNRDTLISICGGYTFYWMKVFDMIKEYKGQGSNTFQIALSGNNNAIDLTYNFYEQPDQLVMEDQNGKQLFTTSMIATNGDKQIRIPISNSTKLIFKIKSSQSSSVWRFKIKIE